MGSAAKLATAIKQRRKAMGLSVMKVAEKIGVTRQCVSKWERAKGEESIRSSYLAALEKALELSPGALLRIYYSDEEGEK